MRVQLAGESSQIRVSLLDFHVLQDEMFVVDASVACGYVPGADFDSVAGFDVAVGVVSVGSDVGGLAVRVVNIGSGVVSVGSGVGDVGVGVGCGVGVGVNVGSGVG